MKRNFSPVHRIYRCRSLWWKRCYTFVRYEFPSEEGAVVVVGGERRLLHMSVAMGILVQ